jgi:DNA-binding IclR family transcriptional regulator
MPVQPNQSLIHGLACLEHLASATEPVRSIDIAQKLGFDASKVHRLLGTLADLGFAERTAGRRYRTGPGIHILAALTLGSSPLLKVALPVVRQFADIDLAIAVGVRWGEHVCYLWHGKANIPVEKGLAGSRLYPVRESSIGNVLCDWESDAELRARGWCLMRAGQKDASLAVPIGDPPYAGLALAGAIPPERVSEFATRLQTAAAQISAACTPWKPA